MAESKQAADAAAVGSPDPTFTFRAVSSEIAYSQQEDTVLGYWEEHKCFEKSLQMSEEEKRPEYTFYDGPPFATGLPHYGHILAGTIKDVVTRWQHQKGFHVVRRFGWDTHGLPVEYEIDKKLKIRSRDDVHRMGIDRYNAECRAIVMRYAKEWEHIVKRVGRWIDFRNDYKTLNPSFMESVWWVFKTIFEKGLVYQGFKVMPYSTGCHTPLSNFESGADCYKDVTDPAVVVSFPVIGDPDGAEFLAWTTTPWTLPSNLALCVHPEIVYLRIKDKESGRVWILAKSCLGTVYKSLKKAGQGGGGGGGGHGKSKGKGKNKKGKKKKKKQAEAAPEGGAAPVEEAKDSAGKDDLPYELLAEHKGRDLKGMRYEPLFTYFEEERKNGAWQVLNDEYVEEGSGTGVVHQAPAFGEDDYRVCLAAGIVKKGGRLVCPVDDNGEFTDEVPDFVGQYVKKADRNIIRHLKKTGRLVDDSHILHPYPHCWRSDTPLIYKAVPSWFVDVPAIKDKLVANNAKTYWVPAFVKEKRFHNWLDDAREWSVSRDRFWGTPIPVWQSEDGKETVVVGSIQELKDLSGRDDITDLHRDSIDDILIPSREGRGSLRRVPQVFDCWFESGSMPYAQVHYPFENKERFEQHQFPADFIAEGLDQTRGWFYTLMVLSTALFDKPAFQNLIVNGLVLASDGKKMSKRLKNYPDPLLIVNRYGADALRLYLVNSPVVRAEPLKFKEDGVRDVVKDLFVPWNNTYRFFVEQHRRYQQSFDGSFPLDPQSAKVHLHTKNVMDKWILSSLQTLIEFVEGEMKGYRLYTVMPRLVEFIMELSLWYVRFNKNRLKGEEGQDEAKFALQTLYEVLLTLCRLMSPFTPFLVDYQYLNLRHGLPEAQRMDSVHHLGIPPVKDELKNAYAESSVKVMQTVVTLGRTCRDDCGVSFRVPVSQVLVVLSDKEKTQQVQEMAQYVKEQINCKELKTDNNVSAYGTLQAEPDNRAVGQALRGDAAAVKKAISKMTQEQIQAVQRDGSITLPGVAHPIKKEYVAAVTWKFEGDEKTWAVASSMENGMMVLLNKVLTEELEDEGRAREVTSKVQQLRKKAGLSTEDEVEVFYQVDASATTLQRVFRNCLEMMNGFIRVDLRERSTMPRGLETIAEDTSAVGSENVTIWLTRAQLVFNDAALSKDFPSASLHVLKEDAWMQEHNAPSRHQLRLQAAKSGLEVDTGSGTVTVRPGVHFFYTLAEAEGTATV